MSNLIEQIFTLDDHVSGDAIILQDKKPGSNGAPNYIGARAIIQRINTAGGWQWCLRSLQYNSQLRGPIAGSGIYGDLNEMAKQAERLYAIKSDNQEWIGVGYTDPEFPPNLIPL